MKRTMPSPPNCPDKSIDLPQNNIDIYQFDAGAVHNDAYRRSLEHIYGRLDFERLDPALIKTVDRDLDAYGKFLSRIGDPHLACPTIHATGTRGKGSTIAHLEAILRQAGYLTGSTYSPHLVEVRERIRLAGRDISRDRFARIYELIRVAVEHRKATNNYRTVFELLIALAFKAFQLEKVDFALIEAGMGGKLDATNVVQPVLSIITRIGLDHTKVLGDTIAKIANDKSHIIKKGIPAVIGPQTDDAVCEIENRASITGSDAWRLGKDAELTTRNVSVEGTVFDLKTPLRAYNNIRTPLLGRHQAENAALAILAADRLVADGHADISSDDVFSGLQNINWPGRGEIIKKNPVVILDGAHSPLGAEVLNRMLSDIWHDSNVIFVFGFNRDKDVKGFLNSFTLTPGMVIATSASSPRSLSPSDVAAEVKARGWKVIPAHIDEGMDIALSYASKDDIVVVTGSFYVIGAVRRKFLHSGAKNHTFLNDDKLEDK